MRRQKSNLNKINLPSRVDCLSWQGQTVYIKRDDLIEPYLSGNKYRKLYYYLNRDSFEFSRIISYGGIQSNAMLSMAVLAHKKNIPFTYYTRYLPENISLTDKSNYTRALAFGMQIEVVAVDCDEALRDFLLTQDKDGILFIPQGGATTEAHYGVKILAEEILQWKKQENFDDLLVITPSGTGTTALYLHEYLSGEGIRVVTTPVVGDANYLKQQMLRTFPDSSLPTIIETKDKYVFAKPNYTLYKHYKSFLNQGIEFDLIYAGVMWQAVKENSQIFENKRLLYIHSGGVMGNESQLQRYEKLLKKFTD